MPATTTPSLRIPPTEMQDTFFRILLKHGMAEEKAQTCARLFMENSLDGVYTHGTNRFRRFVEYIKKGYIQVNNDPECRHRFGGMEQWDGRSAPGQLNALFCADRATELAAANGIGCVTLSHTNHWMRGGTYGWHAAKKGFVFIGWTNTVSNMPAWGATDARLGNNPLVLAVPYGTEAIVLDMAMSQYSFGAMELSKMKQEPLAVAGGYDAQGNLSTDPASILASRRTLPVGYWKGAGLSLLLDVLATLLSGGMATHEISKQPVETSVSQVFIAIDISKLGNYQNIASAVNGIISDYHQSVPVSEKHTITFPGERVLKTRQENQAHGIPVLKSVWEEILGLM